ncbi:MAG TPA: SNF2-related protein [Egibacteraceae bacterium]|nr:SNF2-related protein [Egibacteraceae bacterium]
MHGDLALDSMHVTFLPNPLVPAEGRLALYDPTGAAPTAGRCAALGLPAGALATARIAGPASSGGVAVRLLEVAAAPLGEALPALLDVRLRDRTAQSSLPDSLRAWALAARLGLGLVQAQLLLPDLRSCADGSVRAAWRVVPGGDSAAEDGVVRLALAMPPAAHALARPGSDEEVWSADALLRSFLDAVADLAVRSAGISSSTRRPRARLLPWTARWAEALADPVDPGVPLPRDSAELVAAVAAWHASSGSDEAAASALQIHLRTPDPHDGPWRLALSMQIGDAEPVPAAAVWRGEAPDAAWMQETLLRSLARGARVFTPLERSLGEPTPTGADLSVDEAWDLLHRAAPLLKSAGIAVIAPDELESGALRLRLRVGDELGDDAEDDEDVSFGWEAAVGDEPVDSEELNAIIDAGTRVVWWRDRWVHVDPDVVARVGAVGQRGRLTLPQGVALALGGPSLLDGAAGQLEAAPVVAVGRVAQLLEGVRAARDRPPIAATPAGFVGELRPYQRRGVAWLHAMGSLGLGAVLADDMGLGKTVQLIAYLLTRAHRSGTSGPWLVICPTSVLGNWQRELARFAPKLPVVRHHGPQRAHALLGVKGVVLTSYGTLRRDAEILANVDWDVVTLDEAQQVKNPGTVAAEAVRKLRSGQTVAMTGTPLENRLGELWALMQATNPGLLGSRAAFARRFEIPIERRRERDAALRLRQLVAPFVLRREKSDPEIAPELPPKIERDVVCTPTSEQVRLYQTALDTALGADGALASTSAIQRRGQILALLTRLKQVCNHPAHYLREDPAAAALRGRSGKLAALCEIVAEALGGDERVIVFTQYVAMGRLLVRELRRELGVDTPFLHGGLSAAARDEMVSGFQDDAGPPVLVVSLRAGGTGLNLTAATQVVHYDRWWNPAVEDQATDRAHRIGQTATVEVHRLVTAGTLEERIAALLERKRALADTVVGAGETWITELSDADLRALVALSDDVDIADLDDVDDAWRAPA